MVSLRRETVPDLMLLKRDWEGLRLGQTRVSPQALLTFGAGSFSVVG